MVVRYLAIDYGKKRIGLAFGEKGFVWPLRVYQNDTNILAKIASICLEEKIDGLVLGLSQDLKEEIASFAQELEKKVKLPIIFQNESLTTREAIDKMLISQTRKKTRRNRVDAVAAAQILTAYFQDKKS